MSKELEALKRIENYEFNLNDKKIWNRVMGNETFNIGDLIVDVLDDEFLTIEQALLRNEPMKVGKVEDYVVFAPIKNVTCKRCNQATRFSHRQSTTKKYKPNFCSNCGQKLDWSESDE